MILLVYVLAYSFYNVLNLNILYAIVPWNQGVPHRDMLVRVLYAAAAMLAAAGALLLTWSTAYRPPTANQHRAPLDIGGRYGLGRRQLPNLVERRSRRPVSAAQKVPA